MASSLIQVFVKLLSGDLIPLSVDQTQGLDSVKQELHKIDPISYPLYKIQILHLDEEKENDTLYEGEILAVFINHYSIENNVFLPFHNKYYNRFVIPLERVTFYIYYNISSAYYTGRQWWIQYYVSITPIAETDQSDLWLSCLYDAVCKKYPNVTPEEMKEIYHFVLPNIDEEMKKIMNPKEPQNKFEHCVNRKEKLLCDCGSIVTRNSLNAHRKSSKHSSYEALKIDSPSIIHEQTYIDISPVSESFRSLTANAPPHFPKNDTSSDSSTSLITVQEKSTKRKKPTVKSF